MTSDQQARARELIQSIRTGAEVTVWLDGDTLARLERARLEATEECSPEQPFRLEETIGGAVSAGLDLWDRDDRSRRRPSLRRSWRRLRRRLRR